MALGCAPGPAYEAVVNAPVPTLRNARRLGRAEPRIVTPPLRPLTPETSLGFEVIDFARDVLFIDLYPWQKALLIRALELLEDGSLRFRTVVVLVARQNGKSLVSKILALWWMFVCGCPLVLGTAQDLDTAEEVWESAVDLIESSPDLASLADTPVRVNGKKSIRLLKDPDLGVNGERYKVKAANRRAGRGLTGDRILLDELREHQTWDAWGAITKTTRTKRDAQIWCFSNAGDVTSVVLRSLRVSAHKQMGDPDGIVAAGETSEALAPDLEEVRRINVAAAEDGDDVDELDVDDFSQDAADLFLAEWSASPDCDPGDRDEWAQSNPSLGYLITERTIASEARTDPEPVFRAEVLCQWTDAAIEGPFPPGSWEKCAVQARDDGRLGPADRINLDGRRHWGVAVTNDRRWAFVAVAGFRTSDDVPQIEIAAKRVGSDWLPAWFGERNRADTPAAIRAGSQAWAMRESLEDAGVTVVKWAGESCQTGCAALFEAVRASLEGPPGVRHTSDPHLSQAAQVTRVKALAGGAWDWDLSRSPRVAAALDAATAALWGLLGAPTTAVDSGPPAGPAVVAVSSVQRRNDIAIAMF